MGPRRTMRVALLVTAALAFTACGDDADSPTITATTTAVTAAPTTVTATSTAVAAPTTSAPGGATTTSAGAVSTSPVSATATSPLFGVAIGNEVEDSLTRLTAALGAPTFDSGWNVGCTLDDPVLRNERFVTWNQLRVFFERDSESTPGRLRGYAVVLARGAALAADDRARRLALPAGVAFGTPIRDVATAVGAAATIDPAFGLVRVITPGLALVADGTTLTAPMNAMWVPRIFSCE